MLLTFWHKICILSLGQDLTYLGCLGGPLYAEVPVLTRFAPVFDPFGDFLAQDLYPFSTFWDEI